MKLCTGIGGVSSYLGYRVEGRVWRPAGQYNKENLAAQLPDHIRGLLGDDHRHPCLINHRPRRIRVGIHEIG